MYHCSKRSKRDLDEGSPPMYGLYGRIAYTGIRKRHNSAMNSASDIAFPISSSSTTFRLISAPVLGSRRPNVPRHAPPRFQSIQRNADVKNNADKESGNPFLQTSPYAATVIKTCGYTSVLSRQLDFKTITLDNPPIQGQPATVMTYPDSAPTIRPKRRGHRQRSSEPAIGRHVPLNRVHSTSRPHRR